MNVAWLLVIKVRVAVGHWEGMYGGPICFLAKGASGNQEIKDLNTNKKLKIRIQVLRNVAGLQHPLAEARQA